MFEFDLGSPDSCQKQQIGKLVAAAAAASSESIHSNRRQTPNLREDV